MINYMPGPAPGAVLPGTTGGFAGGVAPGGAQTAAGTGNAQAGIQDLLKALMLAKMRKPQIPGTVNPGTAMADAATNGAPAAGSLSPLGGLTGPSTV